MKEGQILVVVTSQGERLEFDLSELKRIASTFELGFERPTVEVRGADGYTHSVPSSPYDKITIYVELWGRCSLIDKQAQLPSA